MVLELYPIKKVTFCHFSVVVERESGTVTFHASLFKCPGWKFVGKVWNFCVLLLDDVTSWWMFEWRSGALARAQIYIYIYIIWNFVSVSDQSKRRHQCCWDLSRFILETIIWTVYEIKIEVMSSFFVAGRWVEVLHVWFSFVAIVTNRIASH